MKKFAGFITGLLLFWSGCNAQDVLSLSEAIKVALENNFAIKIAANQKAISENNYTLGNAGFLPIAGATSIQNFASNDTYQERNDANKTIIDIKGAESQQFNVGTAVNWVIFDGLGMFRTYERLSEQQQSSNYQLKITMENTISDVLTIYYSVALENERIKVLNNSLQLSERRTDIAKNKYEIGKASKMEYLAAQVDYNSDKTLLINQEQLLYQAKVDLNRLLAREVAAEVIINDTITINESLLLEALLESANLKNPLLLKSQRDLNIAHLQLREIKSERSPMVSLNSGYSKGRNSSQVGFSALTQTSGFYYGISASLNLFNGFNLNRRIENARIQTQIVNHTIDDLKLSLQADINKMYNKYTTSLDLINIERQNLGVAKENENIALDRYTLGNSTPLELREAQINAVAAESRLINAAFSTKLAEIELLRLSGRLIESYSNP
ncbi:MAG: TolC family protein [Flammeovirgaceae bacterium]|nr:TolC family protein [Flammeovirgaceae bacterium]